MCANYCEKPQGTSKPAPTKCEPPNKVLAIRMYILPQHSFTEVGAWRNFGLEELRDRGGGDKNSAPPIKVTRPPAYGVMQR